MRGARKRMFVTQKHRAHREPRETGGGKAASRNGTNWYRRGAYFQSLSPLSTLGVLGVFLRVTSSDFNASGR
jgi:hypothetical protein